MQEQNLIFEKEGIEQFERTAKAFMHDVLGFDGLPMLTDSSQLSDFAYDGDYPPEVLDPTQSRMQWTANWDRWVIGVVKEKYGITLTTTVIDLMTLFRQIEAGPPTIH